MICSHEDGEEQEITNNTLLVDWTGTEIVHCRKQEIAAAVEEVMNRQKARGMAPYYIFGNKYGTGNEGNGGRAPMRSAYKEIREYERPPGLFPLIIFFFPQEQVPRRAVI